MFPPECTVQVKAGSDDSSIIDLFSCASVEPILQLGICMWKKSYAPVAGDHRFPVFLLQDSIYLASNLSLWLPLLCGSDPLTSGDPGKVLSVSPLSSLGLPSLFASSCS